MSIAITRGDADVNGTRLHYFTKGSGEPLVVLHGWPQTSLAWMPTIDRLSARYTVIAPDLRGAGQSAKPESGYDKKTMAEDIRALVHSLGFRRVHLVGHDMGATVIYPYACMHGDEVASLTFVDVPALGIAPLPLPFDAWHFGFHQTADLPEKLTAGRERVYLQHFLRTPKPGAISSDAFDAYAAAYSAPGAMKAGFEMYRAFAADAADNAGFAKTQLAMPVLCVGGEYLFGDYAHRVMTHVAPDIRGVVIPGIGHWIPEEAPDAFCDALLAFLDDVSSASTGVR